MATIIDELILVLGWGDAPNLEKGQRDADDALKKTKDRAVKQAEEIEGASDLADAFAKITTEAALFFAALAAFNAAKDLIIKVNRSNSALGRFAANVGVAPQEVASWSMAAERMGGSAQDAQSSVDSIAKAIFSLNTEGVKIPDEISRLSALSGVNIDMRDGVSRAMADIAEAAQKLSRIDPAQTHFLLRGMGIADSVGAAMLKYGRSTGDTARMLAPSNEAIKAAQDLSASFARAQEDVKSLGSAVAEQLDPVLAGLLDSLSSIIEANKALEASEIVEWAKSIASGLKKFAEVVKRGIDTLAEAEEFLDRTAPPSILHPRTPALPWSEWWKDGEQFLKQHNPLDIGAHADELPPGFDEGDFESRRARSFSNPPDSRLTIQGQQISRGNPMPVDIVRDSSSFLGGPMGSGGTPPTGAGPGSGHGASDGLRSRGTPGGAGNGPNVTPQPDDTIQSLAAKYRDRYPHLSSQQCVALAMATAGIGGTVIDWRRGDSVRDTSLEPGTPIATFLNPDGTPGANRDHAAIFLGKTPDGIWVEEQFTGSRGPHAHFYPWKDPRGGERSAENYFAINDSHGLPAGTNNPHRHPLHALPSRPYTPTPSGGARLSMLAGPQAAASRSTTRNIARLQVKGSTAQEIADNLVAGIRAELSA